jgi:hypothetical protein
VTRLPDGSLGLGGIVGDPNEPLAAEVGELLLPEAWEAGDERGFILMQIGSPSMQVNEATVEIDPGRGTAPMLLDGRTVVPIRAVVETVGGSVDWDDTEQKITLTANGRRVEMWLDQNDILADGESHTIDVAPTTINDRTMVPVRFVAENIDCQIEWIGSTQEVIIVFRSTPDL